MELGSWQLWGHPVSSPVPSVGWQLNMCYLLFYGRFLGDSTIFFIVSHPSDSGSSSWCLTVSFPLLLIMLPKLALLPDNPVSNNGIISLPVTAVENFRVVFLFDSLCPSLFLLNPNCLLELSQPTSQNCLFAYLFCFVPANSSNGNGPLSCLCLQNTVIFYY